VLKQPTDAAEIQQHFDVCFETSSIEGWPLLVVEVWDRTQAGGEQRFCGCGAITLPTSPGKHVIDCVTWKPIDTWWSMITGGTKRGVLNAELCVGKLMYDRNSLGCASYYIVDYLLNYTWEYKRSQVLTALLQPNERPSIRTVTAGVVRVEVYTITAGFEEGGAVLCRSQAD
jgi:hypothetical protein